MSLAYSLGGDFNAVSYLLEGRDDLVLYHAPERAAIYPEPETYALPSGALNEARSAARRSRFERLPGGKIALHLPALEGNRSLLILQSPIQRDIYMKHAAVGGLAIDATHGSNRYDQRSCLVSLMGTMHSAVSYQCWSPPFHLFSSAPLTPTRYNHKLITALTTTSDTGTAIPIAFAVASEETALMINALLACIVHRGQGVIPAFVMTDGSMAEKAAIDEVFVNKTVPQLLCVWHLNNAITAYVKRASLPGIATADRSMLVAELKYFVSDALTPEDYDTNMQRLKAKYADPVFNDVIAWFLGNYHSIREKWSLAFRPPHLPVTNNALESKVIANQT